MNSDFINKSNYLVAFLAAIIGLSAFKDALATMKFTVFGYETSMLHASVPLIIAMLLAAYIGALSHFSSNITFTKLPLSRYLSILSNFIAVIGLIYPLIVLLLFGLQLIFNQFANIPNVIETLYQATTTAVTLFSLIFAAYAVKNYQLIKQDLESQAIINTFENSIRKTTLVSSTHDNAFTFLNEYEVLQRLMVRYLQFRGYGISGRSNLLELARILNSKNVFGSGDVETAGNLNKIRNNYAHGKTNLTKAELNKAEMEIKNLQDKIKAALIEWTDSADKSVS